MSVKFGASQEALVSCFYLNNFASRKEIGVVELLNYNNNQRTYSSHDPQNLISSPHYQDLTGLIG